MMCLMLEQRDKEIHPKKPFAPGLAKQAKQAKPQTPAF